jgi:hypothetical protein
MPRGGHNKKSIEEHIKNGTYRPDRQGIPMNENNCKTLVEIETDLKSKITKIKTELETIDMIKDIDTYKGLMSTYLAIIKSYNILVKENKQTFIEENKDDDYKKYPSGKRGDDESMTHWMIRRKQESESLFNELIK